MKKSTLILISIVFAMAVFCQPTVAQDEFKPITVFLVRHAEREDEPRQDPPLSKDGVARSQALARLLGNAGIKAIFTSQFTRTKQTAEPLDDLFIVNVYAKGKAKVVQLKYGAE